MDPECDVDLALLEEETGLEDPIYVDELGLLLVCPLPIEIGATLELNHESRSGMKWKPTIPRAK